jgi:hypothetical protein
MLKDSLNLSPKGYNFVIFAKQSQSQRSLLSDHEDDREVIGNGQNDSMKLLYNEFEIDLSSRTEMLINSCERISQ